MDKVRELIDSPKICWWNFTKNGSRDYYLNGHYEWAK